MRHRTTEPCVVGSGFTLVAHEQSMARLMATMRRVGATMSPEAFTRAVSNAYHALQVNEHVTGMHSFFRQGGLYPTFKRALTLAKQRVARPVSVLDIGCGAGYELEVFEEVFAPAEVRSITGCDLSPEMMSGAAERRRGYPCRFVQGDATSVIEQGPYDLVMTHAMVHHVCDLEGFFRAIDRAVAAGGAYVMGSEPNNRYWTNRECLEVLEAKNRYERRRHQLRKYFQPQRYWRKFARVAGWPRDESLHARVNQLLRAGHGLTADLTVQEISRLVDVHIPDGLPGGFKIGLDGFDVTELRTTFLKNFELAWVGTSGYVGATCNPTDLPKSWREAEARLAQKFPLDGSNFSAVWWKPGRPS